MRTVHNVFSPLPVGAALIVAAALIVPGAGATADAMERDTLTVVTYNIWHGLNPVGLVRFEEFETPERRETRLQGFFAQVRALDPDILFLQEVNPAPEKSERIARELGYDRVYQIDNAGLRLGGYGIPANLRSGLAILAKKDLALEALGGSKLSGPPGFCSTALSLQYSEFRYAVAAAVTVNGRRLLLMDLHLHHGPEVTPEMRSALDDLVEEGAIDQSRASEVIDTTNQSSERRSGEFGRAIELAEAVGYQETPMLMAGDFNAAPGAPELDWLIRTKGFRPVSEYDVAKAPYTWDTEGNPNTGFSSEFQPVHEFEPVVMDRLRPVMDSRSRHIDYIFHRRVDGFLVLKETGVFGDTPHEGIMASDHFGVYAVFEVVGAE